MEAIRTRWAVTVLAVLALGISLSMVPLGTVTPNAGAAPGTPAVAPPMPRTDVLVVRLYFHDFAERDRLATQWGADEISTGGGYLTIWVDRPTYSKMLAQRLHVEIDQALTQESNNPALTAPHGPDTFYGGYKTVEEMQTYLDQEVAAHPTLAVKVDFGNSWCKDNPGQCTLPNTNNGYDLFALHITNQAIAGPKPVYWYEAAIHSREIAVPEVAMRFIGSLLDNYDSNPDSHWLVDYHDIWVVPMLNPDGHHIVEAGGGGNSPYYQRKNANHNNGCNVWPPGPSSQFGTDNNRNFSFLWNCCGGSSGNACDQTYRGPSPASDPETFYENTQVRSLIADQRGPNLGDPAPITTTGVFQDMHSNASLDLYPWGWTGSTAPNGPELANIGNHLSATNAGPPGNGYQSCQPPNCLYAVDGDAFDWAYGELGAAAFSTEVGGSSFFPAYSYIDSTLWPLNRGALTYQAKIARTPYLLAHGPDTNNVTMTPMTVTQGTPAALAATINYAWTGNNFSQNVGAAEYYVDTPPWAGGTAVPMTGNFTSATVAVSASVPTGSLSVGRHIIFVRGRGATDYLGYQTWGAVSAVFLGVLPSGGGTPTPTTPPIPSNTPTTPPANTATATQPIPTTTETQPPIPSNTPTILPIASNTPTTQPANTPTTPPGATNTPTTQPANTATPTTPPANTPTTPPGATDTPTTPPGATNTPTTPPGSTVTPTAPPANTATATAPPGSTATATVAACAINFSDVHPSDYFYTPVQYLYCHGVISGYSDGTFRPYNNTTRSQMVKIVVLGFNKPITTPAGGGYSFTDVQPSNNFYSVVETAYADGIISGYNCGSSPAGPCDAQHRPYFLPYNLVTRGQLAKIDVLAAGWPLYNPLIASFGDVPRGSTFYVYVETAVCHGVISGYNDRTFRPYNDAIRGQISKIVYLSIVNPPVTCGP